jgi:integrase
VFTTTVGTPLDVSNLTYGYFRPLLERAGLSRIRFHDLRHTCVTLLPRSNVNSKIVQELLGHTNIRQRRVTGDGPGQPQARLQDREDLQEAGEEEGQQLPTPHYGVREA